MSKATQPIRVVLFDVGGVLVQLSGVATVLGWVADRWTPAELWQRWLPDFLIDVHTMLRLGAAQLQQLPAPRHPAAATLTFDTVPPMTFDLA